MLLNKNAEFAALVVLTFLSIITCSHKPGIRNDKIVIKPFNDISAAELVSNITIGWNLGNTLDYRNESGRQLTVSRLETMWNNPLTTQKNFDTLKNAGFNAVRIPVTWHKCVNENYIIREDWIARVKEVVNYGINNNMYIVLNTHHDEKLFKLNDNEMDESLKAFKKIWEQIARAFNEYDEKLIFEGLNEPRTKGTPGEWMGGTEAERNNLNIYYQVFVDTVRASGGNNNKRVLMINTYGASRQEIAMAGLTLPRDTVKDKLIVSIHNYQPYNFALNNDSPVHTWNRDDREDTINITDALDRAHSRFVNNGIPVIFGEFGAMAKGTTDAEKSENESARAEWAEFYVSYALDKEIKCFYWDDGGWFKLFNRGLNTFYFPKLKDALIRGAAK